jgi:hypothetical protein
MLVQAKEYQVSDDDRHHDKREDPKNSCGPAGSGTGLNVVVPPLITMFIGFALLLVGVVHTAHEV